MVANYGIVRSVAELSQFVDRLIIAGSVVSLDIETGHDGITPTAGASLQPDNSISKVVGFSFTNSTKWARYVPLAHDLGDNLDVVESGKLLWKLLNSVPIIAHNALFELRFLRTFFLRTLAGGQCKPTSLGSDLGPGFTGNPVPDQVLANEIIAADGYWTAYSDTMIEAYIAQEYPRYGLKYLTEKIFNYEQQGLLSLFPGLPKNKAKTLRFNSLTLTPEVISYACEDAVWCLALHHYFYPKVKDRDIYRIEMAVLPITCGMEDVGAAFDWAAMGQAAEAAHQFAERYDAEIQADLSEATGRVVLINLNSPHQLRTVLFADPVEGGLGLRSAKETETGLESTGASAMEALSKKHPVIRKILNLKELRTLSSKYLDKYPVEYSYAADGRSHPSYLQANVISGRYSCTSPNVQQQPREFTVDIPHEGRRKASHYYQLADGSYFTINFREYVIAPPDHFVGGFDYGQQELRVLAGEAQEPYLIKAFEDGVDVHAATAALMFGIEVADVTKELRNRGKTANFAILYGQGPKAMADSLAVSVDEAKRLQNLYFSSFVNIDSWMKRVISDAYRDGHATSKFGRIHKIWNFQSDQSWQIKAGERDAVNYPIQGGAANLTKLAMIRARKALQDADILDRVHLFLNVHDALEFYVHDSISPHKLKEILEPAVVFPIEGWPPMVADWHAGPTFGSLQDLTENMSPATAEQHSPDEAYGSDNPSETDTVEVAASDELDTDELDTDGELVADSNETASNICSNGFPQEAASERAMELAVTITAMPTADQSRQFFTLVRAISGPHEVRLVTPQGELVLADSAGTLTTGLTPQDQGRISLLLGGAEVSWTDGTVDVFDLASGLIL